MLLIIKFVYSQTFVLQPYLLIWQRTWYVVLINVNIFHLLIKNEIVHFGFREFSLILIFTGRKKIAYLKSILCYPLAKGDRFFLAPTFGKNRGDSYLVASNLLIPLLKTYLPSKSHCARAARSAVITNRPLQRRVKRGFS